MKKGTLVKIGFAFGFATLAMYFVAITAMTAMSFREIYGGQWVCIANECGEWATGDDWITDNCRPDGEGGNATLVCNLIIEDKEYNAPLAIINISKVRSCRQQVCITEVYVRGTIIE